jgi:DNA-binding HxlR family transcriptional regulator
MSYRCKRCEPLPEEVRDAAELLGRRWALALVYASHAGAVRFNEFRQVVGEIPPRTLALRLTELEDAGLLERTVVPSRPPRVEYRLTPQGLRLKAMVDALRRWAQASA